MKKVVIILIVSTIFNFTACKKEKVQLAQNVELKKEKFRPNYHFTPKANWMNDPNGLVYFNNTYHLFYQYYPDDTVWGPMHWGHAKSKDLLNWEHLPIALYPDELGYIFSGSAVIDKNNTAGFGTNAMVAIFTYHDPVKEKEGKINYQTQGIAYSLDEGNTWKKFKDNPVIENPGIKDFRDPKVFWNQQKEIWQMVLVAKDHVQFYESENLKSWKKLSDFRFNDDPQLGVWECPDLFKLKVEDTNEEKWVLIVSHGGESSPNGGSGTRYFVGEYDGMKFTTNQKNSQWIDYGTDNYAGVTFNDVPNEDRIFIGWMSNWNYATVTPTEKWRSSMTLPRELKLLKSKDGYLLKSSIINTLSSFSERITLKPSESGFPNNFKLDRLQESWLSFELEVDQKFEFQFSNELNESISIGYDKNSGEFFADRRKSGQVKFNYNFNKSGYQKVQIGPKENLSLDVLFDSSSVEIFINEGEYVMTLQIFPNVPFNSFKTVSTDNTTIKELKLNNINLNNEGN